FQKKVAEKQKSLETVVWEKSWDPQARIMTWPEPFEEMYHFRDGFFANEIKVDLREAPKDAPKDGPKEPAPPETPAQPLPKDQFQGVVTKVDPDTFEVRGPKKEVRKFYRTEDLKVVVEGGSAEAKVQPGFEVLKPDQRVTVTFTQGK